MGCDWLSIALAARDRHQEALRESEAGWRMIHGELDSPHWQDRRREEEPWLYEIALPPRHSPLAAESVRQAVALAARAARRCGRGLDRLLIHRHRGLRSFETVVREAGGIVGCLDAGYRPVPLEKVVGSVGRAATLRSDFYHRTGTAVTERYYRIEAAMRQDKALPAVELYRMRRREGGNGPASEYYVLDGHHRVAVARKLGQSYLDAHVVDYKVADDGTSRSPAPNPGP